VTTPAPEWEPLPFTDPEVQDAPDPVFDDEEEQ
jgi:hypothetical protein